MTEEHRKIIEQAIHSMADLIHQLEPDPEYMEMYGVGSVMQQAKAALEILNKQGA